MNVRLFSLTFFAFVAACSSSTSSNNGASGVTKTSVVTAKTVEGVCQKLDSMSCAQPNCNEQLSSFQKNCNGPYDDFQGLLDCMSSATFECKSDGSVTKPYTAQCSAEIQRVSL